MIKVLKKTFSVLEILQRDGEASLDKLAVELELNRGTLCNILKSLIELGVVVRSSRSNYRCAMRFVPVDNRPQLPEWCSELLHDVVRQLASGIGESIVTGTLRGTSVEILSQCQPVRQLMVNSEIVYANLSLYHSVTGRILVGYGSPAERKALIRQTGFPGKEWDHVNTWEQLEEVCSQIRRQQLSTMENLVDGIKSFAVPVCDTSGRIMLTLAMTMPLYRLENEEVIIRELRKSANFLAVNLCTQGMRAEDFYQILPS